MIAGSYRTLLKESFKSNETEEWLDIWFTRPIGLAIALMCGRLGITPNAITLVGIALGMAAGWMFHYTDLWHNIAGVALLMTANFCDSADGQLARLTNQKTLLGRMLDGFASDVWFFCAYLAIVFRLWDTPIPFTGVQWQWWGFLLCAVAGLHCHSTQCALADYYRNIHLWFLKGDSGSELDSYAKEQAIYDRLKTLGWTFERLYHFFYKGYCRKQERLTPRCQQMLAMVRKEGAEGELRPEGRRNARNAVGLSVSPFAAQDAIAHFLDVSRPLMPLTNILTHNTRAFALFFAVLVNIPWLYPLFEIVVLQPLYWWMRYRHELLCSSLTRNYENN